MRLLDSPKYRVERAVIDGVVRYENARVICDDENAAVVVCNGWYKCVFGDMAYFCEYRKKYDINGNVCILGAPADAPRLLGFDGKSCQTFAYLDLLPPPVNAPHGVVIKRLAPTLAETVANAYSGGYYDQAEMAEIMRKKGVFGAIYDGALAGFIGSHDDGSMGMLEVFPKFRRIGIGGTLERFLINYIMTFGRIAVCDVYTDNVDSIRLQQRLGLTQASGYTFWFESFDKGR